jgi:hypothetical protein
MQHLLALALLFSLSCNPQQTPHIQTIKVAVGRADSFPILQFPKPDHSYAASRILMGKQRQSCKDAYATGAVSSDSVGKAFTDCLLKEIIPHWFGTHWTFSGHTETPGQGDIACGYFVSTTLRHNGLNLNRYRLAQQSPADEASMLSQGDTVWVTHRDNTAKALALWRTRLRDGLYFVGLGAGHVGYLLKKEAVFYFIHSNYMGPFEVQMQRAEDSVLMGFPDFYLANITYNRRLMEYWMSGGKVPLEKTGVVVEW